VALKLPCSENKRYEVQIRLAQGYVLSSKRGKIKKRRKNK